MFQKLGDALRRFMYGRYGADSLNKWLLIFAVVLMLVGGLGSRYLARRRENAAFQRFFTRLRDRQNRYFTCPRCRQVVRVPRGKGRINIRCPKCGEQFIKKT